MSSSFVNRNLIPFPDPFFEEFHYLILGSFLERRHLNSKLFVNKEKVGFERMAVIRGVRSRQHQ